ncbi:MAG: SulP family inorganic anion transporter [Ideonella sp.]|nr:SulP family inorganic anion transporter [Ideonella sp.]MCC7457176.1 SulP family inorganic anion transporter [Nitrospira sp.]
MVAPGLSRLLPFLRWWPRVDRASLHADAVAGFTGGIVLVPQGVAFATIAGMPPEYGLYAAMLPAIVAALWGSSWHLVSGPTTAISIVVFATIGPLAEAGSARFVELVLTLTLLVGVFQLALGALRLGTLVNFVSHTVVVGFTAGAAVLIAVSQVKNFFGLPIPRGAPVHEVLTTLIARAGDINPWITAVAVVTVLASIAFKRWWPRVPHMIAAMLAGGVAAAAINALLPGGAARSGVASIGALEIGLPPLSAPDLSPGTIEKLVPIALAVALLALTEAVSIARAIALKSGQRIDGNQEFIGQGLSNLAGAFFSGYASSGSFNRSGLNFTSGARTPLAAVFSALFLLLIVLFLAPLAQWLPTAAMAGILFVVAWGLIDFHHIAEILRSSRQEAAVLIATFVATLTLDLEFAIYIGVLLSLMLYLNRTSRPPLEDVKPDAAHATLVFNSTTGLPDCPQLKIVRLNGSIFFGAVNHLQEALQGIDERNPSQRHLLLVATGINFVDLAGAQLLGQEARRRRALGGGLYLYNLKDEPRRMLERCGQLEAIGRENVFALGEDAIGAIRRRLDAAQCARCAVRIFEPCREEAPPAA